MAVMQMLLLIKVIDCQELSDDPFWVVVTLSKTILNILVQFIRQYFQSTASQESVVLHCLYNMTARVSCLPFHKKIRDSRELLYLNYGNL